MYFSRRGEFKAVGVRKGGLQSKLAHDVQIGEEEKYNRQNDSSFVQVTCKIMVERWAESKPG